MLELHEIEELFKSEDLVKNKAMLNALLRNAALLHREDVTPEQKQIAMDNIKSITHGKQPKVKEPKAPKEPKMKQGNNLSVAPVQSPIAPSGGTPVGKINLKYSPAYQHYGITPEHWNAAGPEAHQGLFQHHNEVMAGKHPDLMHIKDAVNNQAKLKLGKSLDELYDLFSQLKKHL